MNSSSAPWWLIAPAIVAVAAAVLLAVRGTAVLQHDGYVRKPSGTDTKRLNAMVRYQPFKRTTLSGSTAVRMASTLRVWIHSSSRP